MIRKALWDGSQSPAEVLTSLLASFSRADAIAGDDGQTVAANTRRYAASKLICGAPITSARQLSTPFNRVWGGRWRDGATPCLVQHRQDTDGHFRVVVHVGSFVINPTSPYAFRSTDITGTSSTKIGFVDLIAPGSDNGRIEVPQAIVIGDGMIFACCESFFYVGGSRPWRTETASICWWNENSASTAGAWELIARLPSRQTDRDHGAAWMATGPWTSPSGTSGGVLKDFFIAWTDYRSQTSVPPRNTPESSQGGFLSIIRATRSGTTNSDVWTPGNNVILYEEAPTAIGLNMHFHSGSILFPEGSKMVVVLSIGDTTKNNRLVKFERSDFTSYDQGWAADQATAKNPSDSTTPRDNVNERQFPPSSPTQNGWTTSEDRQGQRARVHFDSGGATYNVSGSVATITDAAAFQKYTHPTGTVTPILVTNGLATANVNGSGSGLGRKAVLIGNGVTAISSDKTVLTLSRPFNSTEIADGQKVFGYIASDDSVQCVAQAPGASADSALFGGDEQGDVFSKIQVTDGASHIKLTRIYGVPGELADDSALIGAPGQGRNLTWNSFLINHRPLSSGREYAALVAPGSIPGWQTTDPATSIMYSPDGTNWCPMFAPNKTTVVPSAFFGTDYYLGDQEGMGLTSTVVPGALSGSSTVRYKVARPLSISPGGKNYLRKPGASPEIIELVSEGQLPTGSGYHTTFSAVARGSTSVNLSDPNVTDTIPLPPCSGAIMRAQMVDSNYLGVWRLTPSVSTDLTRWRIKFWVYVLPPAPSPTDINTLPPAASGCNLRFTIGWRDDTHPFWSNRKSDPFDLAAIAASGWVPITLWTDTTRWNPLFGYEPSPFVPPGFDSDTFELVALVTGSGSELIRQDILIAMESVVGGATDVELPAMPLVFNEGYQSANESLTLSWSASLTHSSRPSTWCALAALRMPDTGPDFLTTSRSSTDSAITAFSICETLSGHVGSVRVVLDRVVNDNMVGCAIRGIDDQGAILNLFGPAADAVNYPRAQRFWFLRGSPVLVGLARLSSGQYQVWASVGGTRVATATGSLSTGSDIRPNQIRTGDQSGANPDSCEFFGIWIDDASVPSDVPSKLSSLDFLA